MKSALLLIPFLALALSEEVNLAIDKDAFDCQCTPGLGIYRKMQDTLKWCKANKPIYEGTDTWWGGSGRKQDDEYCIFWKLGMTKDSGKDLDYAKLKEFLKPVLEGLDMLDEFNQCKALADKTVLDDDSGWWDATKDFFVGENYKFSLVTKKMKVLEKCVMEEREKSCVKFVTDKFFSSCA